jgi:large subunit ribosomal protein L10
MIKEKQLLLDEVANQIGQHGSFVVMRYIKLTANKAGEFRRGVLKLGGDVQVMRKRILRKAAESQEIDLGNLDLDGHIGLVFGGNDALETTKYVFKFSQENGKVLEVVGGRFEGQLYGAVDVSRLSQLPGRDEMRALLLSVLEAPMAQTLAVIEALLTSVPHCLENKAKLEGGAE